MQITLQEIKDYLKVEDSLEDSLIEVIKDASIAFCETKLNRPILDTNMDDTNRWEVAKEVRIAIYMLATHWYENRSPIGQTTGELEFSISAILWPHRFRNV